MPRSALFIVALATLAPPPLAAQSAKAGLGTVISDIRADWLGGGVESPNGRFYLLDSYALNDSGFLRYDRVKRSWAHLGRDVFGENPRWSPNGRFVAVIRQAEESRQRHAWVIPMDTATGLASGPPRRISTRPGLGPVAWSPDSRRVAFISRAGGQSSIVAVPFNGGDEQVLFEAPGILTTMVWSPDGRSIFVGHGGQNRAMRTVRVSIDDKRSLDIGEGVAPIIDVSPDGKWVAQYHFSRPVVHLVSTDGKGVRNIDLPPTSARLTPVGWSRTNPNEMVALDHIVPTGVQRVTIADGRIRTVVAFDSSGVDDVGLSPDERQFVYTRLRGGRRQLVVADTGGGNVRVLADTVYGRTTWSPTGQHIAFSMHGNDVRVIDPGTKRSRELLSHQLDQCAVRALNCAGRITNLIWRSDARAVRYFERRATSDGHALDLREVDLDGRQRVVTTTTVPGNPSFITRNDTLFLVRQPNALHLVNVRTGTARVIYSGAARVGPHVDANGQWLLIVAESGGNGTPFLEQPLLVSLTTGESKKYPYALGGEVSGGSFLPDGRNFLLTACVTCREPNYVEKWDLILTPMNGDPPRILTGSEASFKDFWPVAVAKDGRSVYFTAQQSYNTRLITITLPKF